LAKAVFALSPSAQESAPIDDKHGADILLGGHDHLYYASRGVSEWSQLSKTEQWEQYDLKQDVLGAEEDAGDILAIKSGTDFRELSEIQLELKPTNGVRKLVISKITGEKTTSTTLCISDCFAPRETPPHAIFASFGREVEEPAQRPTKISSGSYEETRVQGCQ